MGEAGSVVVTLKVALLVPLATVTLAPGIACGSSLLSATARPPFGALPVKVTVPVVEVPPVTEGGLNVSVETSLGAGLSVKVKGKHVGVGEVQVGDAVPNVALTVTGVGLSTSFVI